MFDNNILTSWWNIMSDDISSVFVCSRSSSKRSLIGSILIFCVGLNLVWGKKIRVANMLPAVVLAVLAAYMPWSW